MRKKAASIVQCGETWCGVTFSVSGKEVADCELHTDKTFEELTKILEDQGYGISLNTSSGYLVYLKFPFSGRRKIALTLNNELEGVLPFPIDETVIDFQEIGKGNVLTAAIPQSIIEEVKKGKSARSITINSLAALYALKWFHVITQDSYAFLYIDGNAVSIMVFKDGNLQYLRQFFCTQESGFLHDAVKNILNYKNTPITYYMFCSNGDIAREKEALEEAFSISIETPSLNKYIKADMYPEWLWAGVGTALLSLDHTDQINLLSDRRAKLPFSNRAVMLCMGCLAGIGILVAGMFYLNLALKERAYKQLTAEQNNVYRIVFPKAPPVKDIGKSLEDKIRMLDRETIAAGVNITLPPLQILAEISSRIDNQIDVKLNEFVCDEKEFSISGTAVSFASVEKIKETLEQIKDMKNVEIQGIDIAAGKQVRFKIRGKL